MTTVLAHLYALRAQLDATILTVEAQAGIGRPAPKDPDACPNCGAAGESQVNQDTLDGTKRRFCTNCKTLREL